MRHFFGPSALCLVVLVSASPAFAQGPSQRPYRALFGSGYSETTQMLRASGTAGTGYATELDQGHQGFGGRSFRGNVAHFSGALSYALQANGVDLSAMTSARYSPSAPHDFVPMSGGRISIRRSLGDRMRAQASATVLYRPYWYGSVFPGFDGSSDEDVMSSSGRTPGRGQLLGDVDAAEVIPPMVEDDVRESEWNLASDSTAYMAYTAGASFSHRLSNRTAYGAHYGYRVIPKRGELFEFARQSVGGEIHHALGQGLSVRGGYTYGQSHRGDGPTHDHHMINAGLGYSRALSISRRTTLSFASGSFAQRTQNTTRFRFTGNATLLHQLGQTWSVAGSIGRSVLVYEAYDDPVVRDGLSVRLHGLLTRRVNFSGSVHTALGAIGLEKGAPAFSSVHAGASVGIAINQFSRGSIVYSYYMHRFDQGTVMPDDSPLALDRHSVRALVNVWAPLFYRIGRGNASR